MANDDIWEFSAPGWYDFKGPNWVPPEDGYFDPHLIENPHGFDYAPIEEEENEEEQDESLHEEEELEEENFEVENTMKNDNDDANIVSATFSNGGSTPGILVRSSSAYNSAGSSKTPNTGAKRVLVNGVAASTTAITTTTAQNPVLALSFPCTPSTSHHDEVGNNKSRYGAMITTTSIATTVVGDNDSSSCNTNGVDSSTSSIPYMGPEGSSSLALVAVENDDDDDATNNNTNNTDNSMLFEKIKAEQSSSSSSVAAAEGAASTQDDEEEEASSSISTTFSKGRKNIPTTDDKARDSPTSIALQQTSIVTPQPLRASLVVTRSAPVIIENFMSPVIELEASVFNSTVATASSCATTTTTAAVSSITTATTTKKTSKKKQNTIKATSKKASSTTVSTTMVMLTPVSAANPISSSSATYHARLQQEQQQQRQQQAADEANIIDSSLPMSAVGAGFSRSPRIAMVATLSPATHNAPAGSPTRSSPSGTKAAATTTTNNVMPPSSVVRQLRPSPRSLAKLPAPTPAPQDPESSSSSSASSFLSMVATSPVLASFVIEAIADEPVAKHAASTITMTPFSSSRSVNDDDAATSFSRGTSPSLAEIYAQSVGLAVEEGQGGVVTVIPTAPASPAGQQSIVLAPRPGSAFRAAVPTNGRASSMDIIHTSSLPNYAATSTTSTTPTNSARTLSMTPAAATASIVTVEAEAESIFEPVITTSAATTKNILLYPLTRSKSSQMAKKTHALTPPFKKTQTKTPAKDIEVEIFTPKAKPFIATIAVAASSSSSSVAAETMIATTATDVAVGKVEEVRNEAAASVPSVSEIVAEVASVKDEVVTVKAAPSTSVSSSSSVTAAAVVATTTTTSSTSKAWEVTVAPPRSAKKPVPHSARVLVPTNTLSTAGAVQTKSSSFSSSLASTSVHGAKSSAATTHNHHGTTTATEKGNTSGPRRVLTTPYVAPVAATPIIAAPPVPGTAASAKPRPFNTSTNTNTTAGIASTSMPVNSQAVAATKTFSRTAAYQASHQQQPHVLSTTAAATVSVSATAPIAPSSTMSTSSRAPISRAPSASAAVVSAVATASTIATTTTELAKTTTTTMTAKTTLSASASAGSAASTTTAPPSSATAAVRSSRAALEKFKARAAALASKVTGTSNASTATVAPPPPVTSAATSSTTTATTAIAAPAPAPAPFIPTAILLARFEKGVRDMPIGPTAASTTSLVMGCATPAEAAAAAAAAKVAQPFQFATDQRAAEKKSRRVSALAVVGGIVSAAEDAVKSVFSGNTTHSSATTTASTVVGVTSTVRNAPATTIVAPANTGFIATVPSSSTTAPTSRAPAPAPFASPSKGFPTVAPHVMHALGEVPDAVRLAAKMAQLQISENTVSAATAANTATVPSTSSASTATAAKETTVSSSRFGHYRDVLNKFKPTAAVSAKEVSNGAVTAAAAAAPATTTTAVLPAPTTTRHVTKAVSPALHTRRRSLERAQFQAALHSNGVTSGGVSGGTTTNAVSSSSTTATKVASGSSVPTKQTTTTSWGL